MSLAVGLQLTLDGRAKLNPEERCALRAGVSTSTLQYWIASCAIADLVRRQECLDAVHRRQRLPHVVRSPSPPLCSGYTRDLRHRRVDLLEGAHADVRRRWHDPATGGGDAGVGRAHVRLRAELLEAQEELVGRRALLEADHRADAATTAGRIAAA